jgi:hypothetical protein
LKNGSDWRLATGDWQNGSKERFVGAAISRDRKISTTGYQPRQKNGSDWRLANGDWSNDSDVGVAISHDGERQRMANGCRRSQSLFAIRQSLFAAVKG